MKKSKTIKWSICISIVSICLINLCFTTMKNYSVYFYTPREAVEKADKIWQEKIRIGGMVKINSTKWNKNKTRVEFVLTDLKNTEIEVSHIGAVPNLFKENSGVVIEGHLSKNAKKFKTTTIMAKHSEEYRVPDDPKRFDTKLLHESIIKNERI